MKVGMISLGCPKNLVDSEVMVGRLWDGPFELREEPAGADVVVVGHHGSATSSRVSRLPIGRSGLPSQTVPRYASSFGRRRSCQCPWGIEG